jgi:hypothetical protein
MKTTIQMTFNNVTVTDELLRSSELAKLGKALEDCISSNEDTVAVSSAVLPADLDDSTVVTYNELDDNGKVTYTRSDSVKTLRAAIAISKQYAAIDADAQTRKDALGYHRPAAIVETGKKSEKGKRAQPVVTSVAALFAAKK